MQQKRARKPLVLHVSGDFPDPIDPAKTAVISSLLGLSEDHFDHRVISINRISPGTIGIAREIAFSGKLRTTLQPFDHGIALTYAAPPRGVRHKTKLTQLGEWLAQHIGTMDQQPDLLVGHKLTIEGIIVHRAAQLLGIPFALSIQGNTDTKILATRRDLHGLFGEIFHSAKVVFPFAPWALRQIEAQLGQRKAPTHLLPCPTELDQAVAPILAGDGLVSVFHLKNFKNKNLAGMVAALERIAMHRETPELSVIGGGTPAQIAACQGLAKAAPTITFPGAMGRDDLSARLNRATAFVMPSYRESFGLVFIEALFAGLPIIYPKDTAVDGYFDNAPFALRVDPRDPAAIAAAMEYCIDQEAQIKVALAEWQGSPAATMFTRKLIAATFTEGLEAACEG